MPRTIKLVPHIPQLAKKKRVAAYARVSSGKDAMLHSLSEQVSYYSDLIQRNSEWLYAGVYSDEDETGTKATRDGFQRLLNDCRVGRIDMVITKSISRFARNTVTLLETVRELKALGIDVFFERENLHTLNGDGELMITILVSYAEEESLSVSENMKWRVKRNFEEGKPWDGVLLGYRLVDGRYEIQPEEAAIVRRIFSEFLSGKGRQAIATQLNEEGAVTRFGNRWSARTVSGILRNYTYTGNLLLQKTYIENHLSKKKCMNNGEKAKYHVERSHPAIIRMDTFNAVQAEIARRIEHFNANPQTPKSYPFSGMMVCEQCGKHYRRKTITSGIVWICETFNTHGKRFCASKQVPEETLKKVTAEALGTEEFDPVSLERVDSILVCNENRLVFRLKDGTELSRQWKDRSRSQSWTPEMKEAARQKSLERRKLHAQNHDDSGNH